MQILLNSLVYIIPIIVFLTLLILLALLEGLVNKSTVLTKIFYTEDVQDTPNRKPYLHVDLGKPLTKNSSITKFQTKVFWGITPTIIGITIGVVVTASLYMMNTPNLVKSMGFINSLILFESILLLITTPISLLVCIYLLKNGVTVRKVDNGIEYIKYIKIYEKGWIKNEEGI